MRTRFCAALLSLTLAFAQHAWGSPPVLPDQGVMGKWWKNSAAVEEIGLAESQISRIEQIYLNHQKNLSAVLKRLQEGERNLAAILSAEPVEDVRARRMIEQVASSRAELEKITASMNLSIRKVLTLDQWKRLEELQGGKVLASRDGTVPPRVVSQRPPVYTAEAKANKIEGIVTLQMVIRKDGTPDSLKVLKALGYGLDESAMDTVTRHWKFEPAMKDGKPVDAQVTVEISFRLY